MWYPAESAPIHRHHHQQQKQHCIGSLSAIVVVVVVSRFNQISMQSTSLNASSSNISTTTTTTSDFLSSISSSSFLSTLTNFSSSTFSSWSSSSSALSPLSTLSVELLNSNNISTSTTNGSIEGKIVANDPVTHHYLNAMQNCANMAHKQFIKKAGLKQTIDCCLSLVTCACIDNKCKTDPVFRTKAPSGCVQQCQLQDLFCVKLVTIKSCQSLPNSPFQLTTVLIVIGSILLVLVLVIIGKLWFDQMSRNNRRRSSSIQLVGGNGTSVAGGKNSNQLIKNNITNQSLQQSLQPDAKLSSVQSY